jgi:hypothetical protein
VQHGRVQASLRLRVLESGTAFCWRQTCKEAMGHFGRITSLADLPPEKTLIGYVRKAADLNDTGVKSPVRAKPNKNRQQRFRLILLPR